MSISSSAAALADRASPTRQRCALISMGHQECDAPHSRPQRAPRLNIPDTLVDLLEVAAYVYAADSAIGRGSKTDAQLGAAGGEDSASLSRYGGQICGNQRPFPLPSETCSGLCRMTPTLSNSGRSTWGRRYRAIWNSRARICGCSGRSPHRSRARSKTAGCADARRCGNSAA